MNNNGSKQSQTLLYLRLMVGGYLVYLAWDLRTALGDSPLFLIAMAVFGLVGAALLVHSLKNLIRPGAPAPESPEESSN